MMRCVIADDAAGFPEVQRAMGWDKSCLKGIRVLWV